MTQKFGTYPNCQTKGYRQERWHKYKCIFNITYFDFLFIVKIPVLFQGSAFGTLILWRRLFECDKRLENPPHEALDALKTPLK